MRKKSNHNLWAIGILMMAFLALVQSCNKKLVNHAAEYPQPTFGLDFDDDSRFGFNEFSVEMPSIEGLYTSYRWAYCQKDSCNTGYYVLGLRCPDDKTLRKWLSSKLCEEMKGEKLDNDSPFSDMADYYLDHWQSYYNSHLNDSIICEGTGAFSYPTEQFGLIITDVWQQDNYYTMCVHQWHDMMSNGCPYSTSYYTIDQTNGHVLTLKDLVSEKDIPQIEEKLKDALTQMKLQRGAGSLQDIDFLEACTGVAMIKEGLLVYYHPYTIGAGFEGQYNVVIN